MGEAVVAKSSWGDDGDGDDLARKFVFDGFVFGPRVETIENNTLLAGSDKIFGFGDGLARDPIFALGFANHFAEGFFTFAVGGAFDATFGHFLINHAAHVDFGSAVLGKIVDDDGFAATGHADDGEDFDV